MIQKHINGVLKMFYKSFPVTTEENKLSWQEIYLTPKDEKAAIEASEQKSQTAILGSAEKIKSTPESPNVPIKKQQKTPLFRWAFFVAKIYLNLKWYQTC